MMPCIVSSGCPSNSAAAWASVNVAANGFYIDDLRIDEEGSDPDVDGLPGRSFRAVADL